MESLQSAFVQVARKPEQRASLKRGVCTEDCMACCGEQDPQAAPTIRHAVEQYAPAVIECKWCSSDLRVQAEPCSECRYIETRAAKPGSSQ